MSVSDQQRKGFIEVLAHFYFVRFIQRLTDQRHKEFLEQLDMTLQSAERDQFDDYVAVLADTFGQCVQKQLSPKQMDQMFHAVLTPKEMHKQTPKSYRETFKVAVPHIHAELYELCSRHKIPIIKLFADDYSMIIQAVEAGISKSQKGYFVPVDGVQSQLDEANRLVRKLKAKLRSQKQLIETLEEQVKEYEKLAEHLSKQSSSGQADQSEQPGKTSKKKSSATSRVSKALTQRVDQEAVARPSSALQGSQSEAESEKPAPAKQRGRKPKAAPVQEAETRHKSRKSDVSFLNGQASLPELRALDNML